MTKRLYLDLETCGLHSLPVLAQFAVEDGPITLYEFWKKPVGETLDLIEWICQHTFVGFNCVFDWYHICKIYTIFSLLPRDWIPEEHIEEIALLEPKGQDGLCCKPVGCLDLLLHSRKGPYQSLMARDSIRIKRVPTALAYALARELETRIELDGIFFAKTADKNAPRWQAVDRINKKTESIDPDFKDVVLRFNPAGGLKYLAEYALKMPPKAHFSDIELGREFSPKELGYAPTALAISSPDNNWEVYKDGKVCGHAWPGVIKRHIEHWATNEPAREYAKDDIVYTRELDKHFGYPEPNDDDSVLACMVAAVRWHGFTIDIPGIKKLLKSAQETIDKAPCNVNRPKSVRAYIYECMDEMEKTILEETTRKAKLEAVSNWQVAEAEPCTKCEGMGCVRCNNGTLEVGQHPAAKRASEVLAVKFAVKEKELYKKLLRAGKLHASFKVIGALSGRMSGGDNLNVQGIKHTVDVRSLFPIKWDGTKLSIGDFSSFEVTIAEAVASDPDLRSDLMTGKSIHAIFGSLLFPGNTYEDIKATKGTENDLYTKAKQGFFASILYGGDHNTLLNKLGVAEKDGRAAIEKLLTKYKKLGDWKARVLKSFQSMQQPGGIGSQIIWSDPAEYAETMLGFKRYYTLENKICRALFDLARKPPKHWKDCPVKVLRRDRVQTAGGAVSSALYGAAFGIQSANVRSAGNMEIQGTAAGVTKSVQCKLWELQPAGVNDWQVCQFQVHDEIVVVSPPGLVDKVEEVINTSVESYKSLIPLIQMDWKKDVSNWGEK